MQRMEAGKNKKAAIIAGIAAVALIVIMGAVYLVYGPKTSSGTKSITITVVDNEGNEKVYKVTTDAEVLSEAFQDAEGLSVEGEDAEYGLVVDTVNGLRADYTKDGAYWSFLVNGEYSNYGVDTQPVQNGDEFRIVYTPA